MSIRRLALTVLLALAAASLLVAQTQEARVTPNSPITSDIFGYDVAFDGTTLLGGAPFGTYSGFSLPGRAFTFEFIGGQWQQTQLLKPAQLQNNAFFGTVTAVDGDTLAIAATGEDTPIVDAGAVYVFERSGGPWTQVARLLASNSDVQWRVGASLALQGDTLLVGANGADVAGIEYAGAVYVFQRVAGGWTEVQILTASDPAFDDNFGSALALDGNTALIGAIDADAGGELDSGAVYVFARVAGTWSEQQRLTASIPAPEAQFGLALGLQGDGAVIGAPYEDANGLAEAGAAYVFQRSNGSWGETQRVVADDAQSADRFGIDVAVDSANLLIGAYQHDHANGNGTVYRYRRQAAGWTYSGQLIPSDPGGTLFGWRLALFSDRAAIAGPFYQTNRGAVYMFHGFGGCPTDLNQDGQTDLLDLSGLLAHYGMSGVDPEEGDLDADGDVDLLDLNELLSTFGTTCS